MSDVGNANTGSSTVAEDGDLVVEGFDDLDSDFFKRGNDPEHVSDMEIDEKRSWMPRWMKKMLGQPVAEKEVVDLSLDDEPAAEVTQVTSAVAEDAGQTVVNEPATTASEDLRSQLENLGVPGSEASADSVESVGVEDDSAQTDEEGQPEADESTAEQIPGLLPEEVLYKMSLDELADMALEMFEDKNLAAAKRLCEIIFDQEDQNGRGFHIWGMILLEEGDFEHARKSFEQAHKLGAIDAAMVKVLLSNMDSQEHFAEVGGRVEAAVAAHDTENDQSEEVADSENATDDSVTAVTIETIPLAELDVEPIVDLVEPKEASGELEADVEEGSSDEEEVPVDNSDSFAEIETVEEPVKSVLDQTRELLGGIKNSQKQAGEVYEFVVSLNDELDEESKGKLGKMLFKLARTLQKDSVDEAVVVYEFLKENFAGEGVEFVLLNLGKIYQAIGHAGLAWMAYNNALHIKDHDMIQRAKQSLELRFKEGPELLEQAVAELEAKGGEDIIKALMTELFGDQPELHVSEPVFEVVSVVEPPVFAPALEPVVASAASSMSVDVVTPSEPIIDDALDGDEDDIMEAVTGKSRWKKLSKWLVALGLVAAAGAAVYDNLNEPEEPNVPAANAGEGQVGAAEEEGLAEAEEAENAELSLEQKVDYIKERLDFSHPYLYELYHEIIREIGHEGSNDVRLVNGKLELTESGRVRMADHMRQNIGVDPFQDYIDEGLDVPEWWYEDATIWDEVISHVYEYYANDGELEHEVDEAAGPYYLHAMDDPEDLSFDGQDYLYEWRGDAFVENDALRNFRADLSEGDHIVMIGAEWCGPCEKELQVVGPLLDILKDEFGLESHTVMTSEDDADFATSRVEDLMDDWRLSTDNLFVMHGGWERREGDQVIDGRDTRQILPWTLIVSDGEVVAQGLGLERQESIEFLAEMFSDGENQAVDDSENPEEIEPETDQEDRPSYADDMRFSE